MTNELSKCGNFSSCLNLVSIQRKREKSKVTLNGSKDLKNEQTEKKRREAKK
jgi:hypothetical protein